MGGALLNCELGMEDNVVFGGCRTMGKRNKSLSDKSIYLYILDLLIIVARWDD